jgi:hypothetical protein
MRTFVIAALVLTCSLGAASAAPRTQNQKPCGLISARVPGTAKAAEYSVTIVTGPVACKTAKSVLRFFLSKSASPRGWACFRGHRSQHQTWAAACSKPKGALVRAYAKPNPKPV